MPFVLRPPLFHRIYEVMSDAILAMRLAWRAKFGVLCLWLLSGLALVVLGAAPFSARQPATVAMDVGFSFIRFTLPLLAVLLVQELIGREFDRRYCFTSLTYPRSRNLWLFGRFAAVLTIILLMLVLMAGLMAVLVDFVSKGYSQGTLPGLGGPYVLALGFLWLDLFVVAAFSLLLAVFATTPAFVLIGSAGFVLIARSYAAIVELLKQDGNLVSNIANPEAYRGTIGLLDFVVPDLGALDVRACALYNTLQFIPTQWPLHVLAVLAYALGLLALASWRLKRRDID
jgi:Cu-processing system permease protein